MTPTLGSTIESDPLWYKDAIIYELHVRAFSDSNKDGIGDFKGLRSKLEYLQDLGVTAIWLLPFCPSPLKDDGYDIADYTSVHPDYGNLREFKVFLREAHKRGMRVITELVLNHTSDQHPWFQRARRAKPGSRWRNFYVWSDTPDKYQETRIIFSDFESSNWSWDPVAKAYYWHRFYSHQPDLNWDSPHVQKAMFRTIDYWFNMGVDGLRLDAVPYLYEREDTNCENLPETYALLQKLRAYVDERYEDRMLLAEANQWPEDAVAYFGNGDECHMAYHFPLMPRMFMALRMEDRFPVIDILEQTPAIPDNCQWALFLRNHDELTLEMVTDEERDYMYRVYANDRQMRLNLGIRRRLAPLLENNRRRIELMNGLLFSLPGSPIIYYGDEIGMGDNFYLGDRNGVRTPMQWSADRNAGFSLANSQMLYLPVITDPEYHYESVNVEAQQNNTSSLFWWTKRLILLRKRFKAFGRGSTEFLYPENRKILAFIRTFEDERILVIANLSRFVQYANLDLSRFKGQVPVEIFGGTEFPTIGDEHYFISLGPHSFFWFLLSPMPLRPQEVLMAGKVSEMPEFRVNSHWSEILTGKRRRKLENILPGYLLAGRWFGGKGRSIKGIEILEVISMHHIHDPSAFILIKVHFTEGDPTTYALPLSFHTGGDAERILDKYPRSAVARIKIESGGRDGILAEAVLDPEFCRSILQVISRRRRLKAEEGEIAGVRTRAFSHVQGPKASVLKPVLVGAEQSNTSVVFGERFILKLFRRLETGENPDLEIGRFLTQKGFPHVPPVAGYLEYQKGKNAVMTIGILQGYVPNEGDAWAYTMDMLGHYFENTVAVERDREVEVLPSPAPHLLDQIDTPPPPEVFERVGNYLESVRLLGERTAELHLALASGKDDPSFAPESFSKLYQRSLYQSLRGLTNQVLQLLRQNLNKVPEDIRPMADRILSRQTDILAFFRSVTERKISALRLRCHGDYHLGQVLFTGRDFVIMDFEGEPARPIGERRIKRSPLKDVAGMLRSFHYAVYASLFSAQDRGFYAGQADYMEYLACFWRNWVSVFFLKAYLETAGSGKFLPGSREELRLLLDLYYLEKAIYEIGYELNNRPSWIKIPLQGVFQVLESVACAAPKPE